MTPWYKVAEIPSIKRGRPVRLRFTRRRILKPRPCSVCKRDMPAGSLFWRRGHISLHEWCFERRQRASRTVNIKGAGRKRVIDKRKAAAIVVELDTCKRTGRTFSARAVARQLGIGDATVRRFIKGGYGELAA